MRAENIAKNRADPNIAFWRNLKEGSDEFDVTRQEPQVSVVPPMLNTAVYPMS
jgi:murein L,D-transpeptidase YafK